MLRIIICFLLLTSAFAPATFAEGMNVIDLQDEDLYSGAEKPSIMEQPVQNYPPAVPQKGVKTGPEQAEEMSLPPANLQHMGGLQTKKPDFGISTHFTQPDSMPAAPEATAATEGPPAPASGDFKDLRQMDTTTVDQVIDPLRIRLKDGRIVQLAGIDIPDLDPYEPGDIAVAARTMLDKLLKGKQVRLYQTRNQKEGRMNRMGYPIVHMSLTGENAAWVQGTLIAAGLARVRPSARNPEMAAQMIVLEDKARKDKTGMWTDLRYMMMTPEIAANGLNNWALIEGTVHSVATVGKTIYLNFGPDWRTDFTIALNADVKSQFIKGGIDPMSLGGKAVRARGWLRDYNGPYMELLHPAWLQILTENQTDTKNDSKKGDSQ